ncbi:MAG: vitamin K epoxide reductase family protein [Planctomycetaceae bacterium]
MRSRRRAPLLDLETLDDGVIDVRWRSGSRPPSAPIIRAWMERREPPAPHLSPRLRWTAAGLVALALALSVLLRVQGAHREATGEAFLCSAGATFDCDTVLGSRFANLLGVPLATWGIFGHLLLLLLLLAGREAAPWRVAAAGALAGCFGLVCVALFLVSRFAIGKLCPFCTGVHIVDLAAATLLVPPAFRALGALPRPAPLPQFLLLAAVSLTPVLLGEDYARSWARAERLAGRPPGTTRWIDLSSSTVLGKPDAEICVVLFLDFGCPYCQDCFAKVTEARRDPAVRERVAFVFKHIPLDLECNPRVGTTVHAGACAAARAAQAAESVGAGAAAFAFLFGNANLGFSELVLERLGKDLKLPEQEWADLRASPAVAAILARDLDEYYALGLEAAPVVFVDGKEIVPERIREELARALGEGPGR